MSHNRTTSRERFSPLQLISPVDYKRNMDVGFGYAQPFFDDLYGNADEPFGYHKALDRIERSERRWKEIRRKADERFRDQICLPSGRIVLRSMYDTPSLIHDPTRYFEPLFGRPDRPFDQETMDMSATTFPVVLFDLREREFYEAITGLTTADPDEANKIVHQLREIHDENDTPLKIEGLIAA